MNDLISRQAAIQEIKDLPDCQNGYSDTYDKAQIIGVLEELSSAQSDGDIISRQAVNGIIDALFQDSNSTIVASPNVLRAFREIQNLPSVNTHNALEVPSVNTHNALEVPSSNTHNALEALELRWIPCSERLPEEVYDEYLVTWTADELGENCCIEVLAYEEEFEFDNQKDRFVGKWLLEEHMKVYTNVRVIAWQPLPEPYKEGDDE